MKVVNSIMKILAIIIVLLILVGNIIIAVKSNDVINFNNNNIRSNKIVIEE